MHTYNVILMGALFSCFLLTSTINKRLDREVLLKENCICINLVNFYIPIVPINTCTHVNLNLGNSFSFLCMFH